MGTAALWKDAAPFELSPVRQVQAHELVVDQIRTAIMLGRFRQGETLPTERQLAAFLQASRTTVQEAVSILASEDILDVRRGRGGGLFVRAFSADEEAVRQALSAHHDRMTEVFDFRLAVESFAAKYAAERWTKADLQELRWLLAAMDELTATMHGNDGSLTAQFVQADTRFHLRIAETARSPWLHRSVAMARVEMFRPVGAIFKRLEPNANDLHEQIVDAIEERDGDKAARFMYEHIDGTRQIVDMWLRTGSSTSSPRRSDRRG